MDDMDGDGCNGDQWGCTSYPTNMVIRCEYDTKATESLCSGIVIDQADYKAG